MQKNYTLSEDEYKAVVSKLFDIIYVCKNFFPGGYSFNEIKRHAEDILETLDIQGGDTNELNG